MLQFLLLFYAYHVPRFHVPFWLSLILVYLLYSVLASVPVGTEV